jgi:hypothetical protein
LEGFSIFLEVFLKDVFGCNLIFFSVGTNNQRWSCFVFLKMFSFSRLEFEVVEFWS